MNLASLDQLEHCLCFCVCVYIYVREPLRIGLGSNDESNGNDCGNDIWIGWTREGRGTWTAARRKTCVNTVLCTCVVTLTLRIV